MLLNNGIVEATELSKSLAPCDDYLSKYDQIVNTQWSGMPEVESSIGLVNNPNRHEIENYMHAAHKLGYKGEVPEQWVGNWKWRGSVQGKRVGIHSGCFGGDWEKKRWNGFFDLITDLLEKGYSVYNLGIEAEEIALFDPYNPTIDFDPNDYHDMAGLYDLPGTIKQMCKCDYFIANDSGLMHIADALGIPTIAIFGPTLVTKNRPVGKNSLTIQASKGWKDDCIPCQYTPNFKYCQSNECLKNISAEFVFEQFINLRKELNA